MRAEYREGERFSRLEFTEETFYDCDFSDCTFIDCGVFYGVHREMLTTNECHRNIVFAGCRFKGPRARLEVQGCTGLELSGNTFDVPEEKAVALTKVVREAATEK